MNPSSANPYASPVTLPGGDSQRAEERTIRLEALWASLLFIIVAATLWAPADPLSMWMAAGFGLGCLATGHVLGSRAPLWVRTSFSVVWVALVMWALTSMRSVYFSLTAAMCGLIIVALGVWSGRLIRRKRFHIFTAFYAGCLVGWSLGGLGMVGVVVLTTLFTKRSLQPREDSTKPQPRYSVCGQRVLERAATMTREDYVGTQHVFLALLDELSGSAVCALNRLGLDFDQLRERIAALERSPQPERGVKRGSYASHALLWTPSLKRAMAHAMDEAQRRGHACIGSGDMLLGLSTERESVPYQVLLRSGITHNQVRAAVQACSCDGEDQ